MPKQVEDRTPFGARLAEFRKTAGLTQEEFAERVGLSRRSLAYYETQATKLPDSEVILKMAHTLKISIDQLLGRKPATVSASPQEARLQNKLHRVIKLPKNDQKAVLRYIDALLKTAEG